MPKPKKAPKLKPPPAAEVKAQEAAGKARKAKKVAATDGRTGTRYQLSVVSGKGIELLPPAQLIPNKRNAKIHGEEQIEKLARTIKRVGFLKPITIDEDNKILTGHGALMAANVLGMAVVPCIRHTGLTDMQKREFMIADNSLAALSSWDIDKLVGEMRDIKISMPVLDFGLDDEVMKLVNAEMMDLPGDLGDEDGDETTTESTEEGTAPPEDYSRSDEEHERETGESLAPVDDAEKPRYHQLPPVDQTRAIRASEERIPLAILLNREQWDVWITYKAGVRAKSDKKAWEILMGLSDPDPLPELKTKTAEELVDDLEEAQAAGAAQ